MTRSTKGQRRKPRRERRTQEKQSRNSAMKPDKGYASNQGDSATCPRGRPTWRGGRSRLHAQILKRRRFAEFVRAERGGATTTTNRGRRAEQQIGARNRAGRGGRATTTRDLETQRKVIDLPPASSILIRPRSTYITSRSVGFVASVPPQRRRKGSLVISRVPSEHAVIALLPRRRAGDPRRRM